MTTVTEGTNVHCIVANRPGGERTRTGGKIIKYLGANYQSGQRLSDQNVHEPLQVTTWFGLDIVRAAACIGQTSRAVFKPGKNVGPSQKFSGITDFAMRRTEIHRP